MVRHKEITTVGKYWELLQQIRPADGPGGLERRTSIEETFLNPRSFVQREYRATVDAYNRKPQGRAELDVTKEEVGDSTAAEIKTFRELFCKVRWFIDVHLVQALVNLTPTVALCWLSIEMFHVRLPAAWHLARGNERWERR